LEVEVEASELRLPGGTRPFDSAFDGLRPAQGERKEIRSG
jgi:hypothetical protein